MSWKEIIKENKVWVINWAHENVIAVFTSEEKLHEWLKKVKEIGEDEDVEDYYNNNELWVQTYILDKAPEKI